MLQVFLMYAFFAAVFTVGKTALLYSEPLFLVGSRMVIAGTIMLLYEWIKRPKTFQLPKNSLKSLLKLAFFSIYLTNVLEFWGLKYLTSFKTCFIYSLSPFVSAIISYFVLSEKLNKKKWIGLIVGCIGFLPILLAQDGGGESLQTAMPFLLPELAVLIACLSSVYGWIILSQVVNEHKISPMLANGLSMLVGGVLALINSALTENWNPVPVNDLALFSLTCLALIVISNFICYNLYAKLLKRYSTTFLSFAGFTTPMFTALFGWFFLKETVDTSFYLSAAVVFTGLILFNQEELRKEPLVTAA